MVHIHNGILVIKRNAFESVLMRWMSLIIQSIIEPIIQNEVSQKEKEKLKKTHVSYCSLQHYLQ